MKNWIKENLVLVVGLTLPLLLIVLFFVASVLPKAMGNPPQYEMLFTVEHYDYQAPNENRLEFSVKNGQLMVTTKKVDEKNPSVNRRKLLAYDGKSETVREIKLDTSQLTLDSENNPVETRNWQIDANPVSPDGYVLDGPNYGGSGLLGGLFGGGYQNSGYRLKKGGVGYRIPNDVPYYYGQVQFLGWVVKR